MLTKGAYEKARLYIETHSELSEKSEKLLQKANQGPCITISRETGAGADQVSEKLISFFQKYHDNHGYPWTIFDKNIIEKILEDHNLPKKIDKYLVEDKLPDLESTINELLGLQPPKWLLIHKTIETILKIAHTGNVILIGRASNIITENLRNAFHVRLVAPIEDRIKHVQEIFNKCREEAIDHIKREDAARKNYVLKNFHKDIENPQLYHIVINTSLVGYDFAAEMIGKAVVKKYPYMFRMKNDKTFSSVL